MFSAAGWAGLVAGLILAGAHMLGTVPLILEAEVYAAAGVSAASSSIAAVDAHRHEDIVADHDHDKSDWKPRDGLERGLLTVLADVVTALGFSLILVAAYVLAGRDVDWREGLSWGLAGFATFTLAPSIGLPPELPGAEAVPLLDRQAWWLATAAATGGGLALIYLAGGAPWTVAGVLLLVVPHLYGAPQAAELGGTAPASLARDFVTMVLVTNLVFWTVLGALTGHLLRRSRGAKTSGERAARADQHPAS